MDKEELLLKIKSVIETKHRHEYYKHTVDVAKFAYQIMTGEDQREIVISYRPNESEPQKEQRFRLYNSRTQYVGNKILATFNEVERVEAVVDSITYQTEGPNKDLLTSRVSKYYRKEHLQKYVHDTVRRLNFYDPNAWIVNEYFTKDASEKAYSYPMEVFSNEVFDYGYKMDDLQYLLIGQNVTIRKSDKEDKNVIKYTIYGIGHAYRLIEESKDSDPKLEKVKIEDTVYTIEYFPTKTTFCPAVQIGYIRDPETKWNTFVTPLNPAKHILKDLINNKCEYDLHKALHGFLQKFAYAEKCGYIDTSTNDKCSGGTLRISGATCTKCKGTGKRVHTSVQDVILIDLPESKDEQIPLRDYIYYAEIPKHIIDGYRDDVAKLEIDVSYAVFNKDTFTKAEVASTATEVRLSRQSVYNVLNPFGNCVSRVVKTLTMLVADAAAIVDGLTVDYGLPKDYKLDSIEELIDQRKSAIDAGSPYDIVSYFDLQVLAKQNQDNPIFVDQVKAQEKWKPFRDKSKEETIFIISMLPEFDPDKILYTYFEKIFMEIWEDPITVNFHKMKHLNQKAIVDKKVAEIIELKEKRKHESQGNQLQGSLLIPETNAV